MPFIRELPAVVTPSSTDAIPAQQTDGTTRQITPSQMSVLPAGATTARTLAARAADVAWPGDFGIALDGTDQSAALGSALTAVAGKARFVVPAGAILGVGSEVFVPSKTQLEINGIIKASGSLGTNQVLLANGVSDIEVSGLGSIDGNASAQAGNAGCLYFQNCSRVVVRDILITNSSFQPLSFIGSNGVRVFGARCTNSAHSVVFAQGSYDCWALGMSIDSIADEGFSFYGGVHSSGIVGSRITNSATSGISVLNDSGQTAACHDIVIANNVSNGNKYSGVEVSAGSGAVGAHYDIDVIGNNFNGNGLDTSLLGRGIDVNSGYRVLVSGNRVVNTGGGQYACHGISVRGSNTHHVFLTGNQIGNVGVGGGGGGVGIDNSSTNYFVTKGNNIFDDQATASTAYAIGGTMGTNNELCDDTWSGLIGDGYQLTPHSDTLVRNFRTISVPPSGTYKQGSTWSVDTEAAGSVFWIFVGSAWKAIA